MTEFIVNPATLQAAFLFFTDTHLGRAWRNRSPFTTSKWKKIALAALGSMDYAPALYVACGELCDPPVWNFNPSEWTPAHWHNLATRLPGFINFLPEKGLCRYHWEQRKKAQLTA